MLLQKSAPIIPVEKLGPYFSSKACGEILTQNYSSIFKTSIIRPFFMYGVGQNRSMLIPRLFDNVKNSQPIQISGKDGIKINPINVRDAANCILELIEKPENITFNLAGPEILSLREIVELMGKFLNKTPVFDYTHDTPKNLIADISLMKSHFYEPKLTLGDSIHDVSF